MPQLAEIEAECGVQVRLQALGYGVRGFEDFERGDRHGPYWPGELYRDESLAVFELGLGGRRQVKKSSLLTPSVVAATVQATAPAVLSQESGGDYWNLGGVLVTAGRLCVYVQRQNRVTDVPSLEPLLHATRQSALRLRQTIAKDQETCKVAAAEWAAAQVGAATDG